MALKLSSPITELPGVGPARAQALERLTIHFVRDLLYTFPRRYDDFTRLTPIAELKADQPLSLQGHIVSSRSEWGWRGRRRVLRIFATVADETGELEVVWYGLQFLLPQLKKGREVFLAGTPKFTPDRRLVLHSPAIEFKDAAAARTHTARLVPVYPETKGVTSHWLRHRIQQLLPLLQNLPEYLPGTIRERQNLIGIQTALTAIHFPEDHQQLAAAQQRLRFDELFFLQLAALERRRRQRQHTSPPVKFSARLLKQYKKQLPFSLTSGQAAALADIEHDLQRSFPMNRLLQGDVGSGKSAVALLATAGTLAAGYSVAYLAPTEVLARQQYDSFSKFLSASQTHLVLGGRTTRANRLLQTYLKSDQPVCLIGTHALLHQDLTAASLALLIIDEQHRFGVAQRQALQTPGSSPVPHLLSMTATPIPRTLSLTAYGDLDLSLLTELPPGRQPIKTIITNQAHREAAIVHILAELHRGRQAYIVAPLVADSPRLEVKSAEATYQEMQQLFPGIALGLLHGQLSAADKAATLRHFTAGALQMLVATSVVEVGINVPNATVMIIEGAERFGLAQLHQLRGRIGRGEHSSYCYLFPSADTFLTHPRLQIFASTTDGFKIAEQDLQLRGPGEVYGLAQSGFAELKVASLLDYDTIKLTRTEAEQLLKQDPQLAQSPILQKKVLQKNLQTHFE
jgi:ATP-dependent DNA helicase RecG